MIEFEQVEIEPPKKEVVADIKIETKPKITSKPISEIPPKNKPPKKVSKKIPKKSQTIKNRAISSLVLKDIKLFWNTFSKRGKILIVAGAIIVLMILVGAF